MKILMIAALAVAPVVFAAPAHAQRWYAGEPSANQFQDNQCANPDYRRRVPGRCGGSYSYDTPYYNGSFVDNTNATIECKSKSILILFGTSECTRKPAPQMCYTVGGDPIILDGEGGRLPAGYVPTHAIPEEVTVSCGGNTYSAKMKQ